MKVLYYYSQLNIGGAERSTVRLLNYMSRYDWDVTVLLRWDNGKLEHELDKRVKRIYLKRERKTSFGGWLGDACWFVYQTVLCKLRERTLKSEQYDVAINGLFGYNPRILLKRIRARQYYQLLRNDVEKTKQYGKTETYVKKYAFSFDRYIGVSQYTTDSFKRCYPELAQRSQTIYNILPEITADMGKEMPAIYEQAGNRLKILTVGRMEDRSKGLLRMVDVAGELVRDGYTDFLWFLVGDGPDRHALEEKIRQEKLTDYFVLCGATTDPFPYYRYADMVAVLSYYEGLCGVVNEAKLMEKCVLATRFSGIDEQITDGVNGFIVDNDTASIVKGFKKLLDQKSLIVQTSINGLPVALSDNAMKLQQLADVFESLNQEKVGQGKP